jgi:UDP-N-acetylmuramate: L-alanyl-gamma-D-glutamyl-meso-diaminopimelate ligase
VAALVAEAQAGDDIVIMSNGGFGGIHQKLLQALAT